MSIRTKISIGVVCGVVLLLALLQSPQAFSEHTLVPIPEGASFTEVASLLKDNHIISSTHVLRLLIEGVGGAENVRAGDYLFEKPEDVVATLSEKAESVLAEYAGPIASSTRSREEIVTMASIIEEEARGVEDQHIVSGILWKRFDVGMALQVDATFAYTLGKTSHELTNDDLQKDSPYNTYTRTGLPPTPISNPGRSALEAALSPAATPYWYYLTGLDGITYFAETFEDHKKNKERYL